MEVRKHLEILGNSKQKCRIQSSMTAITIAREILGNQGIVNGSTVRLWITWPNGKSGCMTGKLTSGEFYIPSVARKFFRMDEDLIVDVRRVR